MTVTLGLQKCFVLFCFKDLLIDWVSEWLLCWVFVSVLGLSLVVASGGHSSSRCTGLSLSRPLLLRSTGSRHTGSVIVAHGPSCSAACGIFPDQGSNPCPLHWQADSQPLRHQGSPLQKCFNPWWQFVLYHNLTSFFQPGTDRVQWLSKDTSSHPATRYPWPTTVQNYFIEVSSLDPITTQITSGILSFLVLS